MSVKLLPKSELQKLKAKERSVEIQEGVKIATRVDGLRELHAKTERELELYRTSTLSAIEGQIVELMNKKDKLFGELRQMQLKYDSLMPDIATKRTDLAKFEKTLTSWESKLEKREEATVFLEIDIAEATKKASNAKQRSEDNERISVNLLAQASSKKTEAENLLQVAKNIQETTLKEKEEAQRYFDMRETGIKAREDATVKQQTENTKTAKENAIEKVRIADQWAQLQRTAEKLRQNRLT